MLEAEAAEADAAAAATEVVVATAAVETAGVVTAVAAMAAAETVEETVAAAEMVVATVAAKEVATAAERVEAREGVEEEAMEAKVAAVGSPHTAQRVHSHSIQGYRHQRKNIGAGASPGGHTHRPPDPHTRHMTRRTPHSCCLRLHKA